MGTNDRDKKFGGSIVDGIKRTLGTGKAKPKVDDDIDALKELSDIDNIYILDASFGGDIPFPPRKFSRYPLGSGPRNPQPKPLPYLWTLHHRDMPSTVSDGRVTWRQTPPVVFKAQSVFVNGPPHHLITIIMANVLVISDCPIRLLNTCHTLEELQKLSVDGKLGIGLLNCPTLTPATQAIIQHSGSVEWVSFYGQMIP